MVDDFSKKSSTILILYCDLYYLNFYLIHFLNSFFSKNPYISTDNIKEYLVLVELSTFSVFYKVNKKRLFLLLL